MRRQVASAVALLALIGSGIRAAEPEHASMFVELEYGYGYDADASMQGTLEFLPEVELSVAPASRLAASLRVRLDAVDRLEPGRAAVDSYAPLSRPRALGTAGTAELRDLFIERRSENGLFRIGKQQIVWGRLDGLKVLDVINPQDFREFILDDFGSSRIGLWSIYVDQLLGDWRAEVALVPDSTGHAIPGRGAWFELRAPRFRFGAPPDASGLPIVIRGADHSLSGGAAGLRLSRRLGRIDLGAVAYTGMDHEPLGRVANRGDGPVIERFQERRSLFGVSAESSIGRHVLRAEYAYQPGRVFNTRSGSVLDVASRDQHRFALGVDVDAPLGLFINAQYLVDVIQGAPNGLVRPDREEIATFLLRRSFDYDRFDVELRWYHSLTGRDDGVAFAVGWDVAGNARARLAAEGFGGSADGLFGQFDARDRLTLSLSYTF